MRLLLLALVAVVILAGCVAQGTKGYQQRYSSAANTVNTEPVQRFQLSSDQEQLAKEIVSASLKDPESARFSGLYGAGVQDAGKFSVCGNVNAKNSYGGYVGFKPFVVIGDHVLIYSDQSNNLEPIDNRLIKKICGI